LLFSVDDVGLWKKGWCGTLMFYLLKGVKGVHIVHDGCEMF